MASHTLRFSPASVSELLGTGNAEDPNGDRWESGTPDNAKVDGGYAVAVARSQEHWQNSLRCVVGGSPRVDYTSEIAIPRNDGYAVMAPYVIYAHPTLWANPPAVVSWTGDLLTADDVRGDDFGFDVKYLDGNDNETNYLRFTDFGFDGSGGVPSGNTILAVYVYTKVHNNIGDPASQSDALRLEWGACSVWHQ